MTDRITMAGNEPWEFEAIGTHWNIQFLANSDADRAAIQQEIRSRIDQYDKDYSRFRDDSLITTMSKKAGTYTLPSDGEALFDFYQDLYRATEGTVTPLIGQTLSDSGYDAKYSFIARELKPVRVWEDVLVYDYPNLMLKEPVLLDVGAAGKGYLVDIVAEIIQSYGIQQYIVDAGGDIRICSVDPVRIGLEHPDNAAQAIGVVTLSEGSICGSAGNRRAWNGMHHIINPHTLRSEQSIHAVWVVAKETRVADGIATALFFVDPDLLRMRLAPKYSYEFLIIYPNFSYIVSDNFPGELFSMPAL